MSETTRGLSFSPGALPSGADFNITVATELAVATFSSLGLVADKGLVTETFGQHMQRLNDEFASGFAAPEVAFEPFISLDLTETFGLRALVKAFDAKQAEGTYIYDTLWDRYSARALNSRYIGAIPRTSNEPVAQARAMLLGGHQPYGETGLYFAGKSLKEQKQAVGNHQLMSPADYIIVTAQRREAGASLLDRQTFTRFPQLDTQRVDGDSLVPYASSRDGRVHLGRSFGRADLSNGVRLSVG